MSYIRELKALINKRSAYSARSRNRFIFFLFSLIVIVLVFVYLLYSINNTNRYIDSLLQYNYYQDNGLDEYLVKRIDNELDTLVKEKIEESELYAIISSNRIANKVDLFVNVFGVISILFLGIIGLRLWDSKRDREEFKKIFEEAKEEFKKIERMGVEAEVLVRNIRVSNRATRFVNRDVHLRRPRKITE